MSNELLLINKDHDRPHDVQVVFRDEAANADRSFVGSVTMLSFGSAQYMWHPDRKAGYADPDAPPVKIEVQGGKGTTYTLPAASINVLRGKVEGLQNAAAGNR